MQLGMHLRELLRLRLSVVLALLFAIFAAVQVTYKISLDPPGLKPRALEMGTASTRVLVDTRSSTVLDLRYARGDIDSLTSRALLLGNVMASAPVRAYIARRAHVPADVIRASTPVTPDYPRPAAVVGEERKTSDILRSTDQYRLSIRANPTVPIIEIYAQAPSAKAAQSLANAAVDGLRDYIADVATQNGVAQAQRAQLLQLGRARGGVINPGVRVQALLLTFGFVFLLSCGAILFVSRVRAGWRLSQASEGHEAAGSRPPGAREPEGSAQPPAKVTA